ncbi:MAG: hypothetical protein EOO67_01505 [Microbacterium sp.]|nr:MAG: hypothetical protein EOO67_01505 [Microbacterium sp.]
MSDLDPYEAKRERHLYVPVDEVTLDDARALTLSLTWSASVTLTAPAWQGVVTSLGAQPGDRLRTGTRLVQIDEVWRVAAHTAVPIYAPINGDSSASLKQVGIDLLRQLGYLRRAGSWNWDTLRAVRALAGALGVPHADTVDSIDPAWFVWIPDGRLIVASIDAQVGAPAPAFGAPVASLAPNLRGISVRQESDQSPAPSLSDDEGPFTLTIEGAATTVSSLPVKDRSALREFGRRLAVSHPEDVTGTVKKASSTSGWIVPATSIVVDERNATCVLLQPADDDARPRPLVVTVVPGGGAGVAHVSARHRGTLTVLTNPRTLDGPQTCG